jgi:small subunit ribosomal protein S3
MRARGYLRSKLLDVITGRIMIERKNGYVRITLYSARPAAVFGEKGEASKVLLSDLANIVGAVVSIAVEEIDTPEIESQLIANTLVRQLENRVMFRRAMNAATRNAMRSGALGIKILSSGHRNAIGIAHTLEHRAGTAPSLHFDVDYGAREVSMPAGKVSIKVWVYREKRPSARTDTRARDNDVEPSRLEISRNVTQLPAEEETAMIAALPPWVQQQQVAPGQRLQLLFGGNITPSALVRSVLKVSPKPFELIGMSAALKSGATKCYSVIGRFPSGAVRTVGTVDVNAGGVAVLRPFGYWSLIDPDDVSLDPDVTQVISSTIDLLPVEVM